MNDGGRDDEDDGTPTGEPPTPMTPREHAAARMQPEAGDFESADEGDEDEESGEVGAP